MIIMPVKLLTVYRKQTCNEKNHAHMIIMNAKKGFSDEQVTVTHSPEYCI